MKRAVVTEMMDEEGLAVLREHLDVLYDPVMGTDGRLPDAVAAAHVLVVRNRTRVTRDLIDQAPHLEVVGRLGVGLDNIDLAAARARGIPVIAAKNANAAAVVEYVFAAMLLVSRPLAAATAHVLEGGWDRGAFGGSELQGKTIGLVGVGEIGTRVALRAKAFGMRVLAYDPFVAPYDLAMADAGAELCPLDDLCANAHFISIHVPLTDRTRHMIAAREIGRMRPDATVINAARGGVIDEAALFAALAGRSVKAAVLDVLEEEPPTSIAPVEGLYLTPHVAGLTAEANRRTSSLVAREVLRVLAGEMSPCQVR